MAQQSSFKRTASIEDLNGLGNIQYGLGNKNEAIMTFTSALQMVKSSDEISSVLGGNSSSMGAVPPYRGLRSRCSVAHEYAPDSYFEGECDVGPRPIHSPLHMSCNKLRAFDTYIVESILLYNKGTVHHSDGDHESAAEAYGLALSALTKNWSPILIASEAVISCLSHIRTLVHNNLGQIRYLDGDDRSALFHFHTALQLSKQVKIGVEDEEWTLMIATIGSNLARTQWMTGDFDNEEALHVVQEILRLRSMWLPANHPDVLCSHLNLGFMLYSRGDKPNARLHINEYLNSARQDSSTLDPIPALAYILLIDNEEKDDRLALELVRTVRSLLDTREDFGEINVEVASLLNLVGTILFHRRDLEEAILFYKEELKLENKLAENADGISISVTYNNIGRILQELGRLDEAIACYHQALRTDGTGEFSNAERVAQVLSGQPVTLTPDMSESTLNLYSTIWYNLGLIHDRMASRKEAIVAFKMSLQLRQTLFGMDHQDVACLWYNIGTLQMECQQLGDAFASLQEALRIKRLGSFHEDPAKILTTLNKLVSLQEGRGRLEEALRTHEEILQLHQSSAKPTAVTATSKNADYAATVAVASTLFRMAELWYAQGNTVLSLQRAQQSLDALLRSDVLLSPNYAQHMGGVEHVSRTMLLIGSLQHEHMDAATGQDTFRRAHGFVQEVIRHYGVSSVAPPLTSMLDALHLVQRGICAPVA